MLNEHSKKIQIAQLQCTYHYDNKLQNYNYLHPEKASKWTFIIRQNMIYDTEIKRIAEEDNNSSNNYEKVKIISSKNAENIKVNYNFLYF